MGLGIWDYFYENGEGTTKDFDSKIIYKLLIKNSQREVENPFNFILSQNTTKLIKYKSQPCKIKSERTASFCDVIQRRECQDRKIQIETENHRSSGQQKFQ